MTCCESSVTWSFADVFEMGGITRGLGLTSRRKGAWLTTRRDADP
jgi:hypothetical protein